MNDKFMYSRRPTVRKAFAEKLYTDLRLLDKGETNMTIEKETFHLKWQYILATLLITLGMVLTLSPKIRTLASVWLQEIAGFSVEEQPESPLAEYYDENGVLDVPNATIVMITPSSVESILADPPFNFSLPEYVPEGFEIRADKAAEATSGTWVMIPYRGKTRSQEIAFWAETGTPTLSIGADAAEEITINGQSAMLIRGDWSRDGSHTWDYDFGLSIYWTVDNINYRLILSGIDKDLLDEYLVELIKMAESVH